jgi:hypothetical protein
MFNPRILLSKFEQIFPEKRHHHHHQQQQQQLQQHELLKKENVSAQQTN